MNATIQLFTIGYRVINPYTGAKSKVYRSLRWAHVVCWWRGEGWIVVNVDLLTHA